MDMDRQIALEEEMRGRGIDRYFKQENQTLEAGQWCNSRSGTVVLKHIVQPFGEAIKQWITEASKGVAGNRQIAYKMVKDKDAYTVAYLFARHAINAIPAQTAPTALSVAKGGVKLIWDEHRLDLCDQPWLADKVLKDVEKRGLPRHRKMDILTKYVFSDYEDPMWDSQENRVHLGYKLLDLFNEACGLTTTGLETRNKKRYRVVRPTERALEWINKRHEAVSASHPVELPLVVPPKPWTDWWSGGYHTEHVAPSPLLKVRDRKLLSTMSFEDARPAVDAVNALQETAWAIHKPTLDAVKDAYLRGATTNWMPSVDPLPIPPYPEGAAPEKIQEWRKTAYETYEKNRQAVSRRMVFLKTIGLADRYSKEDAFWYMWQMDFRGRCYARATYLSPQGADLSKGLLTFSKKVRLGMNGRYWLGVHIANCWGEDKLPILERYDWTKSNEDMIIRCTEGSLEWLDADSPVQFLRACFEWKGFLEEGVEFMSSIPVGVDATCSGLQHFAAMLRDPGLAKLVNMKAGEDKRHDAYQLTMDKARQENPILLGPKVFDRSLCKRTVMVVPYAGTFQACYRYVGEKLKDLSEQGKLRAVDWRDMNGDVAAAVWAATQDTCRPAFRAMGKIQSLAKAVCKDGVKMIGIEPRVKWKLPDGLWVHQHYPDVRRKRIKTKLDGALTYVDLHVDKPKQNTHKNTLAAAPNLVHSWDAYHMRETVRRLGKLHICRDGLAFVHDSFGVHAGNIGTLQVTLREAFRDTYTNHNPIKEMFFSMSADLGEAKAHMNLHYKNTLRQGDWSPDEVMHNEFFFS